MKLTSNIMNDSAYQKLLLLPKLKYFNCHYKDNVMTKEEKDHLKRLLFNLKNTSMVL